MIYQPASQARQQRSQPFQQYFLSSTYRAKIGKLFPDVEPDVRSRLILDDVAIYSATDQRISDTMSLTLLKFVPPCCTVVNATSSAAGNTFSFARHFANVVAVEKNRERFRHLCHNAKVLNAGNVCCVHSDAVHVLLPHRAPPRQERDDDDPHGRCQFLPPFPLDLVFIDPPWGGPRYRRNAHISLFLSHVPLAQIVKEMAHYAVCRYVALKLPNNFDKTAFVRDAQILEVYVPTGESRGSEDREQEEQEEEKKPFDIERQTNGYDKLESRRFALEHEQDLDTMQLMVLRLVDCARRAL